MKDAKSSYEKLNEKSLVIKALLLRRLSMSKKNISDKKKTQDSQEVLSL